MKTIRILLFLFLPLTALSEELKPIDSIQTIDAPCTGHERNVDDKIAICTNGRWMDPCDIGSNHGISACNSKTIEKEEKELERLYQLALNKVNANNEKASFIEAQIKWMEYRDSMCKFEQEHHGLNRAKSICLIKLTKHRNEAMNILLNGCNQNGICVAPW